MKRGFFSEIILDFPVSVSAVAFFLGLWWRQKHIRGRTSVSASPIWKSFSLLCTVPWPRKSWQWNKSTFIKIQQYRWKKLNSLFKIKKYCGVRTYYIFKKLGHIKMYDFCGQIVPIVSRLPARFLESWFPALNKSPGQGFYTLIMDKFKSSAGYLILAHIRKTAAPPKVLHNQVRTISPGWWLVRLSRLLNAAMKAEAGWQYRGRLRIPVDSIWERWPRDDSYWRKQKPPRRAVLRAAAVPFFPG